MPQRIKHQNANGGQLVTIREACVMLSCSRSHINRLIASGYLDKIDISHGGIRATIRLRKSAIEALIAERTAS